MRIVRPYGFSRTARDGKTFERRLVEAGATKPLPVRDIPEFALQESQLIIGQWISLIDKIARKPNGTSWPTPEQRAFRGRLGEACWQLLVENKAQYLPEIDSDEGISRIFHLWWSRVHPYRDGEREAKRDNAGRIPAWARVEGRFYEEFADGAAPGDADAEAIARKIETRLYGNKARKGLITARAESIKGNVLHMRAVGDPELHRSPSSDDIAAYRAKGDPVSLIWAKAKEIEESKGTDNRMTHGAAAAILHKHWPEVFRGDDGVALSVTQAKTQCPSLFALHDRVRLCYRSLLKRTRKDTGKHRKEAGRRSKTSPRLSTLLPRNLDEALRLADKQGRNAELGELVRLGKIIHYAAPRDAGEADHPAYAVGNWPQGWNEPDTASGQWLRDIETSDYWTSDGQAEIKRAEAFVRLWRQALTLARWTLTDWVSMKAPFPCDILGGSTQRAKALQPDQFDRCAFTEKLNLRFGLRAETFAFGDDAQCRQFLRSLIDGAASLRHAVFHFKGRQDLLAALARLPDIMMAPASGDPSGTAKAAAAKLWEADAGGRLAQIREALVGAHADHYLTQGQADQVLPLLLRSKAVELPLPRFLRVLRRRENTWKAIDLPAAPNRTKLEAEPERRCQYTITKLIYERPFRTWLAARDATAVKAWIDRAVDRADLAARTLHGKGKPEAARALIVARADRLRGFAPAGPARDAVKQFFAELSRESASEMRIQRGYESDAEAARKQAEYIEDLLCDVVLLAFDDYLREASLDWLRHAAKQQATPCHLPRIEPTDDDLGAEDWQRALYLILHLIPVESVGQLMHQIARWDVAAGGRNDGFPEEERKRLDALFAVMTLYLDMHDAKFTGGMALAGCKDFKKLFASCDEGFRKVFPETSDERGERRIPRRGLRQIARFGHLPLILALCQETQIADESIDRVKTMEAASPDAASTIASSQKTRETLHRKLARLGKKIGDNAYRDDVREYARTVAMIAGHREDSNFVNLVDHVRVHRIVMAVWSRLVDYAGLFERDLYFVTLAQLYRNGMAPADLLRQKGVRLLKAGQTISGLGPKFRLKNVEAQELIDAIELPFGGIWEGDAPLKDIRNRLAHFDLRHGTAHPAPQLTERINDARRLMAYDRKMKNAVTKSVIELMEREGVDLFWSIPEGDPGHGLTDAQLIPQVITHLGGVKLPIDGSDAKGAPVHERRVGKACVNMLAAAFGGTARPIESIVEMIALERGPYQSRTFSHKTRMSHRSGKQRKWAQRR